MGRYWAGVLLVTAACGRVGFESAPGDTVGADGAVASDGAIASTPPAVELEFAGGCDGIPQMRFSRGSGATFWDGDAILRIAGPNQPRCETDPVTGVTGLLLEDTRTNSVTSSSAFSSSGWWDNGSPGLTTDGDIAPDGSTTAARLTDSQPDDLSRLGVTLLDPAPDGSYVCSAFFKAVDAAGAQLACEFLNGTENIQSLIKIDFASETAQLFEPIPDATFGITPVGDGWYRAHIALRNNDTGNDRLILSLFSTLQHDDRTFVDESVLVWGAQMESVPGLVQAGAPSASSHAPTNGAAARRERDRAVIDLADRGGAGAGTLAVDLIVSAAYSVTDSAPIARFVNPSTGESDGIWIVWLPGGEARFAVEAPGGARALAERAVELGVPTRLALSHDATAARLSRDGSPPVALVGPRPVGATQLELGGSTASLLISRVRYWPTTVSDSELIALTSPGS